MVFLGHLPITIALFKNLFSLYLFKRWNPWRCNKVYTSYSLSFVLDICEYQLVYFLIQ